MNTLESGVMAEMILEQQKQAFVGTKESDLRTIKELKYEASSDEYETSYALQMLSD